MTEPLGAGFTDPVRDAQDCFRAVLAAMACPGSIYRVAAASTLRPPTPMQPATAAVLLALVDADVTIAIDPELAPAADWIGFHCGGKAAPTRAAADFVLACALPSLIDMATGSDEAPERSATVVLQIASLRAGRPYILAGPGLPTRCRVAFDGLPADFTRRWTDNHARYPRGVDVILCAGDDVTALPRSVSVEDA